MSTSSSEKLAIYLCTQLSGQNGPVRTLHRDLLLPCGFLSATVTDESVKQLPVRRPRTRQRPTTDSEEEENSDSELVPTRIFSPFQTLEPDIRDSRVEKSSMCDQTVK